MQSIYNPKYMIYLFLLKLFHIRIYKKLYFTFNSTSNWLANTKRCKYIYQKKNLFLFNTGLTFQRYVIQFLCPSTSIVLILPRSPFLTYNRFLFVRKKILHVPCHYEVGRLRLSTAIPISSHSCSRCHIHHLNFIPPALSFTQEICPTTNKIERGYIVSPQAEINLAGCELRTVKVDEIACREASLSVALVTRLPLPFPHSRQFVIAISPLRLLNPADKQHRNIRSEGYCNDPSYIREWQRLKLN